MICNAKLSNSSLELAKLKGHFFKLHGDGKYKETTLVEFKEEKTRFSKKKKTALPVLRIVSINKPILKDLYKGRIMIL